MRITRFLAGLIAAFAVVGAAAAQVGNLEVHGPYTHAASGMTFPTHVGAFQRTSVTRYAPDGSNESAGYHLRRPYVTITAYVYPSPPLPTDASAEQRATACAEQFQTVQAEIAAVSPNATQFSQSEVNLARGDATAVGHQSLHRIMPPSVFGRSHQPLRSETYLFCYIGGRWSVKYRATHAEEDDASAHIAAFLRDLPWTITTGAPL